MILHFATSTGFVSSEIAIVREIIDLMHHEGHIFARNWVESFYYQMTHNIRPLEDSARIYRENMAAIQRAEMLIVEASIPSMGVGYQIASALQMSKPVLVLIKQQAEPSMFFKGVKHPLLVCKKYSQGSLKSIILEFTKENASTNKDFRFNFVLDHQLHSYLRWKSYKTGKTKAEIIRDLVLKKIKEIV